MGTIRVPVMSNTSFLSALAVLSCAFSLCGEEPVSKTVESKIFRPAKARVTPDRLVNLKLPSGFAITPFATDLEAPRILAIADDGSVYVSRRDPHNDVLLLKDTNNDGKAEDPVKVASLPHVHGITIKDGVMYLVAIRNVYSAKIEADGKLGEIKTLYDDLPDAGQHPNRTLKFSKDGKLFLSVGSTCNSAPEPNPENATMLVIKPDGSGRSVFASGLRNTIGFDWHPETGELWGMDHGIDNMGDDSQKEELNLLQEGKNYGWPFVYEDGQPNVEDNPEPLTGLDWKAYAKKCENCVMGFTAHSAPMAFLFYTGNQFPAEYKNSAFITFHGSWNRGKPSGYKVMRLKFENGKPTTAEDFLTGFLVEKEKAQFGRPCDLAMAKDGSLFMSDDSGGVIYRISYPAR